MPHPILLYDGVCGLCNRLVQFVLRRDRRTVFRFASLQSATAVGILARHSVTSSGLDTVYVVLDHELPTESLLSRSDAVIFVLQQLGAFWHAAAWLLRVQPRLLRDCVYNAVARHRYKLFGRSEICILPNDRYHSRFLDL